MPYTRADFHGDLLNFRLKLGAARRFGLQDRNWRFNLGNGRGGGRSNLWCLEHWAVYNWIKIIVQRNYSHNSLGNKQG